MNLKPPKNLIDLKERIAIASIPAKLRADRNVPPFELTTEESGFIISAINMMADALREPDGVLITPNSKVIDTLFVWLSVDGNGHEGIMSMQLGEEHFPCVTSNELTARAMSPQMQHALRASGGSREVKLMTFERGEEL